MIPAHGLKPGWYHHPTSEIQGLQKAEYEHIADKEIRIAYYAEHPTFPEIAKGIEELLKQDGIRTKLVRYGLDSPEFDDIDIWIRPMGIASKREEALAGWLLGHSDIEHMSKPEDFYQWSKIVEDWRGKANEKFPAQELGKKLIQSYQIIPMFHCWLGISKDHCGSLQNAKCNALGCLTSVKCGSNQTTLR